ncbi:MAG: hypothetical protein LC540_15440 [Candidatus Thiodiazotropha sp.]|nr:hypothetical protein [Candidatus Thiodiazotropha sp.]
MNWWQPIRNWYYRWRYRKVVCVTDTDLPERLRPGVCYVAMDQDTPWAASLQCPCGCGELIILNLVGNHPVWKLTMSGDNPITLHPSVWRTRGCESHFWVRQGRIVWVSPHWSKRLHQQVNRLLRLIFRY